MKRKNASSLFDVVSRMRIMVNGKLEDMGKESVGAYSEFWRECEGHKHLLEMPAAAGIRIGFLSNTKITVNHSVRLTDE